MEELKKNKNTCKKRTSSLNWDSLSFAHTSIEGLQKKQATQEIVINELNRLQALISQLLKLSV